MTISAVCVTNIRFSRQVLQNSIRTKKGLFLGGETFCVAEYNSGRGLFGDQKSSRRRGNWDHDCTAGTLLSRFFFELK